MFIGSYLRPQLPERKQMISNFIDNVNSEKQSALHKHTESQESVSPFPIISAGVIIIGISLALTVFLTAPLTEGWISIVVGVLMIIVGLVFRYLGKKALSKDEQIFSKSEEQSV
jgi:cytochrome c biogenesis protein CcdA